MHDVWASACVRACVADLFGATFRSLRKRSNLPGRVFPLGSAHGICPFAALILIDRWIRSSLIRSPHAVIPVSRRAIFARGMPPYRSLPVMRQTAAIPLRFEFSFWVLSRRPIRAQHAFRSVVCAEAALGFPLAGLRARLCAWPLTAIAERCRRCDPVTIRSWVWKHNQQK